MAGIADEETVLGGTFLRGVNGEIILTKNSGHYGMRWNSIPNARVHLRSLLSNELSVDIKMEDWEGFVEGVRNGL